MKHFRAPKESLRDIDPEAIGNLISSSSDIALVLDLDGVIYDLAFGNEEWSTEWYGQWLGRPWVDTVTVESRSKIESLLADAKSRAAPRWRQVNHASSWGNDIPVTYTAMLIGERGPIVACGRELWSTSQMQQRLVNAQQSLERHYSKLRHVEARYRLLFQVTAEAVMVLDGRNWSIVEANPAAESLLGKGTDVIRGTNFIETLDEGSRRDAMNFLSAVNASGRTNDVRVQLASGTTPIVLSASLFRQDNAGFILLRLKSSEIQTTPPAPVTPTNLLEIIDRSPDALVVTDSASRLVYCNPAFLDLVQMASMAQIVGNSLDQWLGRPGVDLNVLLVNLKQHGAVRLYPTTVHNEFGNIANVEVSAVAVTHGSDTHFGYLIRNVDQRSRGEGPTIGQNLPQSVHQLTELVGRVPLKELVRETIDEIERLCIEAALELTGDNRASAAELLGLSRQSLYVKLRRYGIVDAGDSGDSSA